MAQRQPFKPTLPPMGYVNPTLDSNMQPHPATATNDKDPTHLVATTAPILNLSGLKQATLKRAGVVEGEGTPKPHGCPESTSPFSAATLNAANALHETSRMSNISQRGTPTFAMPSPLNFVAQQSPAFMSANNPLLRTPSHAEATRKHADVAISNTPASTAARLFLPDADNNLPLRPSSAASVLHVDRAEFSRFVGHPGNIRMAANAPVASILVNQRNSRARSILREYPLPKEPLLHNPSGRDIQEHVLIPAEDEHEPESQFPGRPHFAATGKRSLDEDSGHEDSARAMTPGNYKRQRLYGTLDDSAQETQVHSDQDNHSRVGGLHREFDRFCFAEATRVAQLRERWSNCNMEEWQEGGAQLKTRFEENLTFVQEYMMKKMLKYMQIQTRVGEHNATLDSLDGKLRDAREMLVKQTGALVATAATHGHEGHNAQRD